MRVGCGEGGVSYYLGEHRKPKVIPNKTTNTCHILIYNNDILDKFEIFTIFFKKNSTASGGVIVCKKSILPVQFDHDVAIE